MTLLIWPILGCRWTASPLNLTPLSAVKWESWPPVSWDCSSFQQPTDFSLLGLPTLFSQTIPNITWSGHHHYIYCSFPRNVRIFYILCFLGVCKHPEPVKSPKYLYLVKAGYVWSISSLHFCEGHCWGSSDPPIPPSHALPYLF